MSINPQQFLEVVRAPLETGDANALADEVLRRWQPQAICDLLGHPEVDVRRVAAITLGLVGDASCIGCLSRALRDEDEQVNQMAEHGLWAIWFRSSDPAAAVPFREGVALVASEAYEQAIERFEEAIRLDPDFAEAYNQCGIARFFLGDWEGSLADCRETLARMPTHFGAMSGMGHCHAHLGDLPQALACYRRAIAINPRMPAIARAVERLEAMLGSEADDASVDVTQPSPSRIHRRR